jgi:hypothetical protein
MLKKIFFVSGLALIFFIMGAALLSSLDPFVKKRIENSFDPPVSIRNLKIQWNNIEADDVFIKTADDTDFLAIKHIRLKPRLWGLLRKKLDIKEVEMDSPKVVIRRTRDGRWLLPRFKKDEDKKRPIELLVQTFGLNKGNIIFRDDLKGFNIDLTDAEIEMKSSLSILHPGRADINGSAKLPGSGSVRINAGGDILSAALNGNLSIKDMDMTLLRPFMKGDARVKKGRLNLDSRFGIDKGNVKAPSALKLKNMDIETKGVLMGISAPVVLELVKRKGEIDITFNVWGKWNNLQNDLQESFRKKVMTEMGRTIVSPVEKAGRSLEDVVKGIGGLLPVK